MVGRKVDQVGESVAKRTTRAVSDVLDKMKLSSRGNSCPAVPWPASCFVRCTFPSSILA